MANQRNKILSNYNKIYYNNFFLRERERKEKERTFLDCNIILQHVYK